MPDNQNNQSRQESNESGTGENKLYAGKFKTAEDLEAAYKQSLPTFQENEVLKSKLKELSTVPDVYLTPSDVQFESSYIADIQTRAKDAGMTQAQYEKYIRGEKQHREFQQQNFEKSRKEVGEETLNLLQDYVKNYPKEVQDKLVETFISDKAARQAALNHRQQLLNNRMPGMDKTSAAMGYRVTSDDIKKAYDAKQKDPKAIAAYLNLIAAKAAQDNAN